MKKGRCSSLFSVICSVLIASQSVLANPTSKNQRTSSIEAAGVKVAELVQDSYPSLMAQYAWQSLFKLDLLKATYTLTEGLDGIDDPNLRMTTKGLTFAIPLGLSWYGFKRGINQYKIIKPQYQNAFGFKGKASTIYRVVTWKNVALATAIFVVWKNVPTLFLSQADYDLLVMTTETNIQNLEAALSAKARESYLSDVNIPSATTGATTQSNADLFKLEE